MNTWLIADTHFGHASVIEYDKRPFRSVEGMNEAIIRRWKHTVKDGDIVYHLGDFSLGLSRDQEANILSMLPGTKVLIRGNHDRTKAACRELGWDFVEEQAVIRYEGQALYLVHDPADVRHWVGPVVHGHLHRASSVKNRYCVSCNMTDYRPVSVKSVMGKLRDNVEVGYLEKLEKRKCQDVRKGW